MNLKTYYRAAMTDLRIRVADIGPVLSKPGSLIYTLSADGADAVIRLGVPSRPVLGYLGGAKAAAALYPADGGDMIRLNSDDAPWAIAALAARYLAQEAGGGLHTCGTDRQGSRVITAPVGAGGVILGLGDDRLRTLAQIRRRLRRAAACAAARTIEHAIEAATKGASVVRRNGKVYGDGGVIIVAADWTDDGRVTLTGPDGVAHMMRPGRTEPVDWRDMEAIVQPVIAAADAYLREHDYYL
jgi:hypothetical protein